MILLNRAGRLIAGMLIAAFPSFVQAEKADRDKPLFFEADYAEGLQSANGSETRVLQGHVLITQGTLHISANKLILKQDQDGFRFGEAFGVADKQASFKQKHEGRDSFIEAFADRVEYDEKNGIVQLFSRVHVKNGQDEFTSEYVRYNLNNDEYKVDGAIPGSKTNSANDSPKRVKGVIYPPNRATERKETSN